MLDSKWQQGIITSAEELQEIVGQPHDAVVSKTVGVLDDGIERYLEMSPIFFLASAGASGRADVSPRGDETGFVKVLDERHLIFPDRMGNRRIDSLLNIADNPQVGMIFLIPGLNEVLRINGRAYVTRSEELIAAQQWKGKTTGMAVIVEVEEAFVHCPRALKQSGIWSGETWPDKETLPSTLEMFKAHLKISGYELKE
ncbi:MSMEG_1061 family FMN-dependent PPOX-type flavoprotein [Paenibacillus methanolicus]|uniref:Pyridoxamine 5'-phosphate oxidase N-terminal domain-containing protein n=1 Tax=Paenibacillus methanolicus TaxID=582686 RepID=A0A5S5BV85_9BACL|nr:MSMEG_1061 family FMN-dependent PPOX-type flavoprotein [Paenibacillus methanolicus]TYP71101.1 hypothetical protein BCM02_11050 [Paenibacillus methanolicus]